jgi:hypothetical protein
MVVTWTVNPQFSSNLIALSSGSPTTVGVGTTWGPDGSVHQAVGCVPLMTVRTLMSVGSVHRFGRHHRFASTFTET